MRKFINWCNQNGGFISFVAIIVVIVIAIVSAINFDLPKFLSFLDIVFLTSIKIPISVLVIILILLIIAIRKVLPDWSILFYKTVKNKVIDYVSNHTTSFIKSSTYTNIPGNIASIEYKNGGYWNHTSTI